MMSIVPNNNDDLMSIDGELANETLTSTVLSKNINDNNNNNNTNNNDSFVSSPRDTIIGNTELPRHIHRYWNILETHFLNRMYGMDELGTINISNNEPISNWLTPQAYMSFYTMAYECCVIKDDRSKNDTGKSNNNNNSNNSIFPPTKECNNNENVAANVQGGELYSLLWKYYRAKLIPKMKNSLVNLIITNIPPFGENVPFWASLVVNEYLRMWKRYQEAAMYIEIVFQYLDRYWVPRQLEETKQLQQQHSDPPIVMHIYPLLWWCWDEGLLRGEVEEALFNGFIVGQLAYERRGLLGMNDDESQNDMLIDDDLSQIAIKESCAAIFELFWTLSSLPKKCMLAKTKNLATDPVSVIHSSSLANAREPNKTTTRVMDRPVKCRPFMNRLLPWYCQNLATYCKSCLPVQDATTTPQDTIILSRKLFEIWKNEMSRAKSFLLTPLKLSDGRDHLCEQIAGDVEKQIKGCMKESLLMPLIKRITDSTILMLGEETNIENIIKGFHDFYALLSMRKSLLYHFQGGFQEGFLIRLNKKIFTNDTTAATNNNPERLQNQISRLEMVFTEGRHIIEEAMRGDPNMFKALDEAIKLLVRGSQAHVHAFTNHLPEGINRWLDHIMRDPTLQLNSNRITFILVILRILDDKEHFMKFHNRYLARRLLGRQESYDRTKEETFLLTLAGELGPASITNSKRMLNDVELSSVQYSSMLMPMSTNSEMNDDILNNGIDYQQEYYRKKARTKHYANSYIDPPVTVQILSYGSWPYSLDEAGIPSRTPGSGQYSPAFRYNEVLFFSMERFQETFNDQFPSRILHWSSTLSTAEVAFPNDDGSNITLIMSAVQVAILEALQERFPESMSLEELYHLIVPPSTFILQGALRKMIQVGLIGCISSKNQFYLNFPFMPPLSIPATNSRINITNSSLGHSLTNGIIGGGGDSVDVGGSQGIGNGGGSPPPYSTSPTGIGRDGGVIGEDRMLFIQASIVRYLKKLHPDSISMERLRAEACTITPREQSDITNMKRTINMIIDDAEWERMIKLLKEKEYLHVDDKDIVSYLP